MARSKYMRASVVTAAGRTQLQSVAIPEPQAEQVLVELEGCGVCGSNLPVWQGRSWFDYPRPPGNPGHEGWGRIAKLGPGVTDWAVGQRVAFLSDNAFAELDIAREDAMVALPPELDGFDVPGEPLGCAMNVFHRSDIQPGQTVAVIGVGFLGALLVQLAKDAGARVIALSVREFSLSIARQQGADSTVSLQHDDKNVLRRMSELTDGQGCDRVIEVVGLQRPLELAGKMCSVRAKLIIAGFHQDGLRQVDVQLWNWRGLDVINAHERNPKTYIEGMSEAIDCLLAGGLHLTPLLTHRVPLAESDSAFDALSTRPNGFVKAVVVP